MRGSSSTHSDCSYWRLPFCHWSHCQKGNHENIYNFTWFYQLVNAIAKSWLFGTILAVWSHWDRNSNKSISMKLWRCTWWHTHVCWWTVSLYISASTQSLHFQNLVFDWMYDGNFWSSQIASLKLYARRLCNFIGCICRTFLQCVFSNVWPIWLLQRMHSHIECICLTFLHCGFSNV